MALGAKTKEERFDIQRKSEEHHQKSDSGYECLRLDTALGVKNENIVVCMVCMYRRECVSVNRFRASRTTSKSSYCDVSCSEIQDRPKKCRRENLAKSNGKLFGRAFQ